MRRLIVLISILAVLGATASAAYAITKVGNNKANVIKGTKGPDRLYGRGGNDTIKGKGGADYLYGDAGNDKLFGGGGRDVLIGGAGNDELHGGPGRDIISCGAGIDTVYTDGKDQISSDCETRLPE